MRTIYVDPVSFICKIEREFDNDIEVQTDFFDDKCDFFVNNYRFVPDGYTWRRDDGELFDGEMVCPAINYSIVAAAQETYEQTAEQRAALDILLNGEDENTAEQSVQ